MFRPADAEDIRHWAELLGPVDCEVLEAVAVMVDGERAALFGLYEDEGLAVAFLACGGIPRRKRRVMAQIVQRARELFDKYPVVIALRDEKEPTSKGFLEHVGFRYLTTIPAGEIYAYGSAE